MASDQTQEHDVRLYDDEGELLLGSQFAGDRVTLLPSDRPGTEEGRSRIRILWGQDMLRDLLDGRYRCVICAVNDDDNSHGIIAQIVNLVATSQWSAETVTSYAKIFHKTMDLHAASDKEPFILKFDLDNMIVLAMLRPKGKDHFSLEDFERGMQTIVKMLKGRPDRAPAAAVSFLGGRSNTLLDSDGQEPSFERVLKIMFESGYRGDVYPAPQMWRFGQVGVFSTYPFPESLDRMRSGGF